MGEYKNMHVNLLRPCVGVDSPKMLYDIQCSSRTIKDEDGNPVTYFTTRNTPKRANEILNGGSVYWIVKGAIVMRQTIVNIETLYDDNERKFCCVSTSPEIMLVSPKPQRPMQGWRYLETDKAPDDLHPFGPNEVETETIDPKMAKELAELGLI
jgi:hypothetical protein